MPQPTTSSVHVDAVMTNMSLRYKNADFIADRVFPIVPVVKESDKYFKFLRAPWFRRDVASRAPGAKAAESGFSVTTATYNCNEFALSHKIPDETRDNADQPLKPDQDGTEYLTNQSMLEKEYQVASAVLTQANWTQTEDVAAGWATSDTVGTNTFLEDIEAGKDSVRQACGMTPNVLVIDAQTLKNLKNDATILDRIKYTERGVVTAELLAAMLDLDEVIVGKAVISSDEETVAATEFTAVDLWAYNWTTGVASGGNGFLFVRPATPGINAPAAGYIFQNKQRQISRWREDPIHSDWLEVSEKYDVCLVGSDACGRVFWDTIASTN